MKTKAVVYPEANKYCTTELTLDRPGPGDMVVKTLVSAISPGTERWILRGKHAGTRFPCVPGYHRIGVVEQCGKAITDFEPGDVVYGCGNRWRDQRIVSMWGAHVGRSVSAPAGYRFLSSVKPNQFELDTLSLAILVGVANRGIRALAPCPTEKLLIIGGGIIGVCAAQLAALAGARPVLLEPDRQRAELVQTLGLPVVAPDASDLDAKLKELAPASFDMVYDTVGHAPTTDAMVQRLRPQGRLLLQAQYFDKEKCAIDLDQIKVREITIKTTIYIDARDFQETVEHIRARRLRIAPLITHRLQAPRDLTRGYAMLDTGKPFNLGIVFRWN